MKEWNCFTEDKKMFLKEKEKKSQKVHGEVDDSVEYKA